jgi:hypothetical protein
MAHIRNDDIYLYTGLTSNGDENFGAYEYMKSTGVPFRHLHYGDPTQHPDVLNSVGTWFKNDPSHPPVSLPFMTYTEVYEVTDPVNRIAKAVIGITDIKATDWAKIASFPN